MIGATVVLAGAGVGLKAWAGNTPLVEAFMTSTFPLALLFGMGDTYLRACSRAARAILIGTVAVVVFLLSLAATFVANLT